MNGCANTFDERQLPDVDPDDASIAIRLDWQGCQAPVVLLRIKGGGHRIPGDEILFGEVLVDAALGVQNDDLKTALYVWNFFRSVAP